MKLTRAEMKSSSPVNLEPHLPVTHKSTTLSYTQTSSPSTTFCKHLGRLVSNVCEDSQSTFSLE